MKYVVVIFLFLIISLNDLKAQNKSYNGLAIEGEYKGKNMLIKNPYGKGGMGFCVTEVKVNGKTTKDEINASMFQVRLDALGLKLGDKLRIEIIFGNDCTPSVSPMIMSLGAVKRGTEKEEKMVIAGKFKWANLFLTNPKTDGVNYSISEIKVNDKIIAANLKSDVVEINLTSLGLQQKDPLKDGAEIVIEVNYVNGFDPIILNPEAVE